MQMVWSDIAGLVAEPVTPVIFPSSQSPPRVLCRYCKSEGHFKENCPRKDCCFVCGQPGHKQADCPARECSAHACRRTCTAGFDQRVHSLRRRARLL